MWNDFLTPLLIGQIKTITVGIYTAIGPYASDWGSVFAYVTVSYTHLDVYKRQVVTGIYDDQSEAVLPEGAYSVAGFDSETEGVKTVTVSYQGKTAQMCIRDRARTA